MQAWPWLQSLEPTQPTQRPPTVLVSQTGVSPAQPVRGAAQVTQACETGLQIGVAPPHGIGHTDLQRPEVESHISFERQVTLAQRSPFICGEPQAQTNPIANGTMKKRSVRMFMEGDRYHPA
jgi:hypothetical protein